MAGRFKVSDAWVLTFSLCFILFSCGCAASPGPSSGSLAHGVSGPDVYAAGACFTGPAPFLCVDSPSALLPFSSGMGIPGPIEDDEDAEEEDDEDDDEEEESLIGKILLYIPNRICDAVEIVRAGVNVGFGIGLDARATWVAKAVFINDMSVGVGFQGFRHLPVCLRAHSQIGVGPIKTPSLSPLDWAINDYDIRFEVFVLIVGAHAAVDLEAILDLVTGFLFFDISEDDFIFG